MLANCRTRCLQGQLVLLHGRGPAALMTSNQGEDSYSEKCDVLRCCSELQFGSSFSELVCGSHSCFTASSMVELRYRMSQILTS